MPGIYVSDITIPCGDSTLEATLGMPLRMRGAVVLAETGSVGANGGPAAEAWSRGHRLIASALNEASFATLRVDLLLPDERATEKAERARFDIPLLASRLAVATDHLSTIRGVAGLPVGYYGAGTGAAAAMQAAAHRSDIRAIVSRAGRVDLAVTQLDRVAASTLLLVGASDEALQRLTRAALPALRCTREMILVNGAGAMFEEPGAMAQVASIATVWLAKHLAPPNGRG